jgi:ubiquitin thioesterase OTU1
MLNFKLTSHIGKENVTFPASCEFGSFIESISLKVRITTDKLVVLTGFPPVPLFAAPEERLESLNLVSGSVITAREGEQPSLRRGDPVSVTVSTSTESPAKKARSSGNANVIALVSMGFSEAAALAAVDIAGDDFGLAVDVCQELSASAASQPPPPAPAAEAAPKTRTITRRIIDADNSCLFNALGYLMVRDKKQMNTVYRQMVAAVIQEDPTKYTSEILDGKSTSEYVSWILDTDKWGGEIEMSILAKALGVEIAAVDVQTGKVYVYGNEYDFMDRVYVLYDGVHYDAIVSALVDASSRSKEDDDVTTFPAQDETVLAACSTLAADLRSKKQFVNLAGCDLKCLVCGVGLRGQADARAHATTTGHQNFAAV